MTVRLILLYRDPTEKPSRSSTTCLWTKQSEIFPIITCGSRCMRDHHVAHLRGVSVSPSSCRYCSPTCLRTWCFMGDNQLGTLRRRTKLDRSPSASNKWVESCFLIVRFLVCVKVSKSTKKMLRACVHAHRALQSVRKKVTYHFCYSFYNLHKMKKNVTNYLSIFIKSFWVCFIYLLCRYTSLSLVLSYVSLWT